MLKKKEPVKKKKLKCAVVHDDDNDAKECEKDVLEDVLRKAKLDFLTDAINYFIEKTWFLFYGIDPFHSYAMSVSCIFVLYNYFNFRWWLNPFEGVETPMIFQPALSILHSEGVVIRVVNGSFLYLIVSPQQAIRINNVDVNRIDWLMLGGRRMPGMNPHELSLRRDLVEGSDLILSSESDQRENDLNVYWRGYAEFWRERENNENNDGDDRGDDGLRLSARQNMKLTLFRVLVTKKNVSMILTNVLIFTVRAFQKIFHKNWVYCRW